MLPPGIDPQRWPALSPLLDELLDLPLDARAARLADVRAQDAALADLLVQLTDQLTEIDRAAFLEGPALTSPPTRPTRCCTPTCADWPAAACASRAR